MTRTEQILPIGTVVKLQNSTALLMIAGYLPEGESNRGKIWDYSGFLYPIGLRDPKEVYLFDQNQIAEIHALGYQDTEAFGFLAHMKEMKETMPRPLEENQGAEE